MCQWFVTEFLDINSEILAQMTGWSERSSNHVFNHFLTPLLSKWLVGFLSRHVRSWNLIFWFEPNPRSRTQDSELLLPLISVFALFSKLFLQSVQHWRKSEEIQCVDGGLLLFEYNYVNCSRSDQSVSQIWQIILQFTVRTSGGEKSSSSVLQNYPDGHQFSIIF